MFEPIRRKLLLSYLGVLTGILLTFSFAVRAVFTRSLRRAQIEELVLLGKAAATTADFRGGSLTLTDAFAASRLTARNQALEWFDSRGNSIGSSGVNAIQAPLDRNRRVQTEELIGRQGLPYDVLAVTIPIFLDERKQVLTGYVRASQSIGQIQLSIDRLDWGLTMGSLVALVSSGVGGLWLMRQSMQPIEESFSRLKQFTADASHELRSPLMAISSNAKVALKYPDGMRSGDRNKFESIQSASSQMSQLTQDLLFLARTETIPTHQQESVDVHSTLDDLVQLYRPQAVDKGVELTMTCPDGLIICGDKNQLNRLLTNLLTNALHYTPKGGIVSVEARALMTQAMIQVWDTGVGIAPEQLSQVFNRFWRAESARSSDQGRSGLGLAIAQAIVNAHQGSITVTSTVNKGSCFTVKLPMLFAKKNSPSEL
ncbi:MAG: HAMP domain-containing sensor histidine kinase [Cyanobacteria bacterium P01_F01_bin.42]